MSFGRVPDGGRSMTWSNKFGMQIACLVLLAAAGCSSVEDTNYSGSSGLEYGCDDVVVIGRMKTIAYTPVDDTEDVLGDAVWKLTIRIKEVVHGEESRRNIPATGVAHAQMLDDVDFLIVLMPFEAGVYGIRTAAVWDAGLNLASRCYA